MQSLAKDREKKKGEKQEKDISLPLSFPLSLLLNGDAVVVVVFAPVALSLDEMMIFSSHSECADDEGKGEREREIQRHCSLFCASFLGSTNQVVSLA